MSGGCEPDTAAGLFLLNTPTFQLNSGWLAPFFLFP